MDKITRDAHVERYYPSVVAPSAEFKALAAAENPELTALWEAFWRGFANTFVHELDEAGAARWEDMLNLHPLPTDSLYIRKQRILMKINATLPYTFRSFQNMLDGTFGTGNAVESIDADKYQLWIELAGMIVRRQAEIRRFARAIAPANLSIHISNRKEISGKVYVGGVVGMTHRTTIRPSLDCHLTGEYLTHRYGAAVVFTSKRITIRGGE